MIKQTVSTIAIVLSLSACGESAEKKSNQPSDNTQTATSEVYENESAALRAFFDRSMQETLKENVILAESLGDRSRNDEWPDFSPEAEVRQHEMQKRHLSELKTFDFDALDDQAKLSYRLFENIKQRSIDNYRWRNHDYPVHQMFSVHTFLPTFMMNVHRITNVKDAEAYIARVAKVREGFEYITADIRERQAMGVLPPKFVFGRVIPAAENAIKGKPLDDSSDDHMLLADFKRKIAGLELNDEEKADLIARLEVALVESWQPAYQSLATLLREQEAVATTDDGVWKLPDGDAYYRQMLENNTTTKLTAEEIHQIGLDNVARIHGEMRAIMDQVGFEGTLQEFFEFTRTDDRFFHENTDEGRAAYIAKAQEYIDEMNKVVPEYFSLTPKAGMEVKRVEPFREGSAGKAFYQRPSLDGSRPGYYYVNLRDMRDMPTYQLEALSYHEGVPGHHFQIALTQELGDLPMFRRVNGFTAFSEGWGLYTEELGKDMGFYQDPYSDFGRLAMEIWRACRLVVDTGIHYKQWTREEAINYLKENTPNPEGDVIHAIERYIVMPGQATAYMIGKLKIKELREKARTELGDAFDWRQYHSVVLESGPVPLSILEENVNAWIASVKADQ